jgi:hypothetical protein
VRDFRVSGQGLAQAIHQFEPSCFRRALFSGVRRDENERRHYGFDAKAVLKDAIGDLGQERRNERQLVVAHHYEDNVSDIELCFRQAAGSA